MRPFVRTSSKKVHKAVPFIWLLVVLTLVIFSSSQIFAQAEGDDFNDNSKDTRKWGVDERKGSGSLTETGGHLEFTCSKGSKNSMDRPWILRQFPTTTDWEITIDVTNNTYPSVNEWSSFGINIQMGDTRNEIEVELAAFNQSITREFYAEFRSNGYIMGDAALGTPVFSASIGIAFDRTHKIFTVYYDADPTAAYQWIPFGTFGVGPSGGGANGNADWGLTPEDKFVAYVFGYSENVAVGDGQMYGDNFQETGGVAPPLPEITGPSNAVPFDTCSFFNPPTFEWTLPSSFQKLELQFFTSGNEAKPTKVKVKGPAATELPIPANTWKKILGLPGPSGGEVNCKIVGINKGEPAVESDVYTIRIAAPQPVESPFISPTSRAGLPTLGWGNACATKFKVYFSPDDTFSRKKTLSFTDKDPLDNGEIFSTVLTAGTWNAIRQVVDDVPGSLIYWYVESWDVLKGYQSIEAEPFTLLP